MVLREPHGVPYDADWDDADPRSLHLAVVDGSRVSGYGRVIVEGAQAQIRHLCVQPDLRGRGIGSELVAALVACAAERGAGEVWLNARTTAIDFYLRQGFVVTGAEFLSVETGIPHVRMQLSAGEPAGFEARAAKR